MRKKYKSPGIIENYVQTMKCMFDIESRSRRAEYWKYTFVYWFLLMLIVALNVYLTYAFDVSEEFCTTLYILFNLIHVIPSMSLMVRRLHDTGHTGKWIFGLFIPLLNFIASIYILVQLFVDSQEEENEWGESPKYYFEDDEM